jgi:hypothetical protein
MNIDEILSPERQAKNREEAFKLLEEFNVAAGTDYKVTARVALKAKDLEDCKAKIEEFLKAERERKAASLHADIWKDYNSRTWK